MSCDEVKFPELNGSDRILYDSIFEPLPVAVQPWYAHRDLCVLPDGEIRHYGARPIGGVVRRVYISSRDCGLSWKKVVVTDDEELGSMVQSPLSGDWLTLATWSSLRTFWPAGEKNGKKIYIVRSKRGPGGTDKQILQIDDPSFVFCRQPIFLAHWKRWIVPGAVRGPGELQRAASYISDDDGRTWRKRVLEDYVDTPEVMWPDKSPRWKNYSCEPTVLELPSGELWMAVRTTRNSHYIHRSTDGGETWSAPERMEGFHATNTMPTFFRMKDGRILFFWNNNQILPEVDFSEYPELTESMRRGDWEDVFTNRDILHAAVSRDNGKTWSGFREICRNILRNASDFRSVGGTPLLHENDKSVHQEQILELPDGKILFADGQHEAVRRIYIFDPDWLEETHIREDFRFGIDKLSTFLYVRSWSGGFSGWTGHCSWNRTNGALLVRDPGNMKLEKEILQLARIPDPRLVSDRQGIVWNYPAQKKGRVTTEARVAGCGFRLTLAERWFNPCDETASALSPVFFDVTRDLVGDEWHVLSVEWDSVSGKAVLFSDGVRKSEKSFSYMPKHGFSYLHLQTLAEKEDAAGSFFRFFESARID